MADWNGYIMDISKQFDQGVDDLNQQVEKALEDLATNPSDPKFLAEYQSALAEYTFYAKKNRDELDKLSCKWCCD